MRVSQSPDRSSCLFESQTGHVNLKQYIYTQYNQVIKYNEHLASRLVHVKYH